MLRRRTAVALASARDPRGAPTRPVPAFRPITAHSLVRSSASSSSGRASAGDERASSGALAAPASRDLPIGGQAVLEGVMMRGTRHWAVAVRLPATHPTDPGGIAITDEPFESVLTRHRALRLPLLRGSVALVESMRVGIRALGMSANAQAAEGEQEPLTGLAWALTIIAGLSLAVGLFFLLPATLVKLLGGSEVDDGLTFVVVEKVVRLSIFIGYLWAVSRMAHLQRVFAYHGAEHQSIACLEAGQPLTPENAARFSRLHPRCGTSFMLIVMIVSVIVFAPLGSLPLGWLLLSRVVGIPLVAGLAFEAIKWMGRHRDLPVARLLMWPGMQLQRMTTREPNAEQLEVAIAALGRVLDHEDPAAATPAQRAGTDVAA